MDLYQQTIYKSRYARWVDDKSRREDWAETVDRYIDFFKEKHKDTEGIPWKELRDAIHGMEIMPSMRALMTAGKALERDNIAGYNCTGLAIDSPRAFDEAMYLLMCGAGLGFSVESIFVDKLPEVAEEFHDTNTTIVVADSRAGWASSFREILSLLWSGRVPKWDVSAVRPAGAKLKTFGGRASGPEPLEDLFRFSVHMFKNAAGRKLTSLECHDLMCKVSEVVVMGGVRRCLPNDSLISTKLGLKKISDINIGDQVVTGKGKYSKVLFKEDTGDKDIVAINTQIGPFYSSKDHRWAVLNDLDGGIKWKPAEKISNKDILVFIPEAIKGTKTSLPYFKYDKPKYSTTCKDIVVPDLDEDMAWLIGQIHGDGSVQLYDRSKVDASDHVTVACSDDLIGQHKKVVEQLQRFGIKVQDYHCTNEKCSKPRATSKQLATYLSAIKTPNSSINVPSFILEGTVDIRAAYIAGLFDADGSAKTRPICVVASIYPDFLRQVQAILASLGIPVVFKLRRKENYKPGWKALYHLNLIGQYSINLFESTIGKYSLKWQQDLKYKRTKEHCSFTVDSKMLRRSKYKSMFHNTYSSNNKINLSYYKFIQDTEKEVTYIPIKIIEVSERMSMPTTDIQVETDECFLVNGILTHNSACISHSDLSDDSMRSAKKGQWWIDNEQRALANNSAIYTGRPDSGLFMQEWQSLYVSKSGERGIVNRKALQNQVLKTERRDPDHDFLLNPCQPDTSIFLTQCRGIQQLKNIPIGEIIWTGHEWSPIINKWSTGVKSVYRYTTSNGYYTECTENHRVVQNEIKIEAKDASKIDKSTCNSEFGGNEINNDLALLAGLLQGDGSMQKNGGKSSYLNIGVNDQDHEKYISHLRDSVTEKNKDHCETWKFNYSFSDLHLNYAPLPERTVSDFWFSSNSKSMKLFLRGLYSANGSVIESVQRITLKSSNKILIQQIQVMLSALGIRSYYTTNKSKDIEWHNGTYRSRESYDLNITSDIDIFKDNIGFTQDYKMKKIAEKKITNPQKSTSIIKVEYLGDMEVFDYTVEADEHTVWQGGLHLSNCAEAILRPSGGLCNLTEVIVRDQDTAEILKRKIRLATILGTLQASLTHFRYLRKIWEKNAKEEALIGVSLTGIMDNKMLANKTKDNLPETLSALKEYAIGINKEFAAKININQAGQVTLVKPSGTVSQLVNCSSGIHPRYSRNYIRRVRMDKKDPVSKVLIEANVPYEDDCTNNSVYVFSFPIQSPKDSVYTDDLGAIAQLEHWLIYRNHWCEGNPSVTIYVKEHEWMEVGAWVYKHFDEIGGLSFLPYSDHIYRQAPYEEIDKKEYDKLVKAMPDNIDWDLLNKYEVEDQTTSSHEIACSGGSCEL